MSEVQSDPLCKIYYKLPEESTNLINSLKDKGTEYFNLLMTIPNCRERSLALTKLEECSMWATKGIVLLNKPSK
jgi:hypothetical protein